MPDVNLEALFAESPKTESPKQERKQYTFNAILKEVIVDGETLWLKFDINGHPHRNEYSKAVNKAYLRETASLLNRYLNVPVQDGNPGAILNALMANKIAIRMWSSSFFDKAKDKYVTSSGFMEKE